MLWRSAACTICRARAGCACGWPTSASARAATAAEARLLDERRGAPLLTMVRTTYDDQGRAVEHGSHVYQASHYSLEVTLIER
ncbi:hypothetical protein Sme01_46210 [Sphaerisporangium melleum]|uniref:UbiC transcription regulator-associated domain-containing protein n=1 Tax=Sphaerisporangium melleum TaxID=321316 RepID=A0A917RD07_9ACTN|nr:UTRA domain-containing protein [Sphaerisporangium melleum]GGL01633.1 hypothetical protein GCM10007964_49620 [Sphaerisporangium melleum]GII72145.1 hypothetical protein Sme01_46210 [Sphaerisporangium melleum]